MCLSDYNYVRKLKGEDMPDKTSDLKVDREDVIKGSQKIAEKLLFYNKNGRLVKEEYYILESITEYNKSGKKEKQTTYDNQGNVTHKVNYAPDGSIVNVINLSKN